MASPQVEDGHTRIANEILEEIPKRKLNGTQLRILMVVWRYTYGFHRTSHAFSLTFLQQATGMSKDSIKREVRRLIKMNVLQIVNDATFNRPRELKFNKDYDQWNIDSEKALECETQEEDTTTGGELSPTPTGGKNVPSQGADYPPPQGANPPPKKESIKDNSKDNPNTTNAHARMTAYELYQQNISLTMNDIQSQQIQNWILDYGDDFVCRAIEVSCLESNGPPTFKWLKYLIEDWVQHGAKTADDIDRLQDYNRQKNKQRGDPPHEKVSRIDRKKYKFNF